MIADEIGGGPEIVYGVFSGDDALVDTVCEAVEERAVQYWSDDDVYG